MLKTEDESFTKGKDDEARLGELYAASRRDGWTWQAVAAALGLVGGSAVAITGALLLAVAWTLGSKTGGLTLRSVGSVLLLATIPLLLAGGHCLDLLERRFERSRRTKLVVAEDRTSVNSRTGLRVAVAALALLCAWHSPARAQQTIFNMPSTDVLDKKKVYAELDASLKPFKSVDVPEFSSFVPRVVVGAGHRFEIGLNVTGNIQPGADATTLVPAFKFKAYDGSKNGWAIVVGDHLFFPVRHRAYTAGNYVYAEVSKTFRAGTRLTAGGYDFTRNVVAASNRAGGQFGFEQPINKKVTLAADYFTGKHAAGYFTPGVVFKLSPKVTGYAGYSVGNQNASRGNHFFLLEVGYNFN